MAVDYDSGLLQHSKADQADVVAAPFTISVWFRTTDMATHQTIVSIADKDNDVNYWQIFAAGAYAGDPVGMVVRDSGGYTITSTSNGYSSGVWHHILARFVANNNRSTYLDGDIVNKGTSAVSRSPANVDRTAVGVNCRTTLGTYMNGAIAEVAIWNVALVEGAELRSLAAGYSPLLIRPQYLVSYWPMIRQRPANKLFEYVSGNILDCFNAPADSGHCPMFRPAPPFMQGRYVSMWVPEWDSFTIKPQFDSTPSCVPKHEDSVGFHALHDSVPSGLPKHESGVEFNPLYKSEIERV